MSTSNSNESVARKRLSLLFDSGIYDEIDSFAKSSDGANSVIAAYGSINGEWSYVFSQDIAANGGAISVSQCKKIKKVYELAIKTGCPIIGIYDSNGVSLNEGLEVLGEYSNLIKMSASASGVVLQMSIIAGACLGSSAVVANMADIVIQVKDTDFYITTPSEITAEDCYQAGTADILCSDFDEVADTVQKLIGMLPSNNLSGIPYFDYDEPDSDVILNKNGQELINAVVDYDSAVTLKDGWANNVATAIATIKGDTVGLISFNGGALCPQCSYKAESLVKLCDAYNIPIITFIDIDSVKKGNENAVLTAITKLVSAYASATTPKIAFITKNAIGAPYVFFGNRNSSADFVFAWENAVASPLDIDSAVAFMYNDRLAAGEDRKKLEEEYKNNDANVTKAAESGDIDDIISPEATREKISSTLEILAGKRENTIPRKHSVK